MRRVLVTGANGFLGSYVCREFAAAGYAVRALLRKDSNLKLLNGAVYETAIGDVRDPESLRVALKDVEIVLHVAAVFRTAKHPDSYYFEVNLEGTRNVFEQAIAAGVKRVIHCSTIGVHSSIKNPPANEAEPYSPTDVYQVSKCEAEKLALSYFKSGKIAGSVIRPAMIWGPGDTRFLKMFKAIERRRFPMIGSGKIWTHWIFVSDLARSFRLAAEKANGRGEIYIIAGATPKTLNQVVSAIAEEYGVKPLRLRIPVWPIQILGSIVETVCVPLGLEPPIHRRRADFFIKNRAFDCSKAKAELGFVPEHTFEQEVKIIANWYKLNK